MTLAEVGLQVPVRVSGFLSLTETERCRLSALGVREGAAITKLLKLPLRDPVECLVGPQLLAIESWLLHRIVVEPQPANP
jgi:Fe2+ transport system protein FeoA